MLAKTPLHELVDRTKLELWRKTLLDGADFMEAKGFAQGLLCTEIGAVCARGAMMRLTAMEYYGARYSSSYRDKVAIMLIADAYLEEFLRLPHNGVPDWNNHPSRTMTEVTSAMRACALQGIEGGTST